MPCRKALKAIGLSGSHSLSSSPPVFSVSMVVAVVVSTPFIGVRPATWVESFFSSLTLILESTWAGAGAAFFKMSDVPWGRTISSTGVERVIFATPVAVEVFLDFLVFFEEVEEDDDEDVARLDMLCCSFFLASTDKKKEKFIGFGFILFFLLMVVQVCLVYGGAKFFLWKCWGVNLKQKKNGWSQAKPKKKINHTQSMSVVVMYVSEVCGVLGMDPFTSIEDATITKILTTSRPMHGKNKAGQPANDCYELGTQYSSATIYN